MWSINKIIHFWTAVVDESGFKGVRIPLKPWFFLFIYLILFLFFIYFIYLFIFWLLLSNCLNWKIYCDDHSSLSEVILFGWFSKYINQSKKWAQTLSRKRFVSGSLFVSPCSPECYLQSETKTEPDLKLHNFHKKRKQGQPQQCLPSESDMRILVRKLKKEAWRDSKGEKISVE